MAASLSAMVVLMSLYVSDGAGNSAPYVVCTAARRRSLQIAISIYQKLATHTSNLGAIFTRPVNSSGSGTQIV